MDSEIAGGNHAPADLGHAEVATAPLLAVGVVQCACGISTPPGFIYYTTENAGARLTVAPLVLEVRVERGEVCIYGASQYAGVGDAWGLGYITYSSKLPCVGDIGLHGRSILVVTGVNHEVQHEPIARVDGIAAYGIASGGTVTNSGASAIWTVAKSVYARHQFKEGVARGARYGGLVTRQ